MRIVQDNLSAEIIDELMSNSKSARNWQYVFASICLGVIFASSGFVAYLVIIVIKDKNEVLGMFAEITKEEIEQTIEYSKAISIKNTRYSLNEVKQAKGSSELYWKLLIGEDKLKREAPKVVGMVSSKVFGSEKGELEPIVQSDGKEARKKIFNKIE